MIIFILYLFNITFLLQVRLACDNEEMRSIIAEAYPPADVVDEQLSDDVTSGQVASMSLKDVNVDLSKFFGGLEVSALDRLV